MSKIVELFKNKWLTIRKKTLENGCEYIYSHADWCNSEGVAILPFRVVMDYSLTELGIPKREFLGRYEICPAHSDEVELCSITGGMDKEGERPVFTAVRELEEEGGYRVNPEHVIHLGAVRPSKSSDNIMNLFAVDVDKANATKVEAVGDGTLGEEGSYCEWIDAVQLANAKDPLLHTMLVRLLGK